MSTITMKPNCLTLLLMTALAILVKPIQLSATLLVYDSFSDPVGALNGQSGGIGFASPWEIQRGTASDFLVAPGSLSIPGYSGVGNSAKLAPAEWEIIERDLSATYGSAGTDLWFSFLKRVDSLSRFEGVILSDPQHGVFGGLYIGLTGGPNGEGPPSTNWSLAGGSVSVSDIPAIYGVTNLFVVHATFLPGSDRFDLYVNPSPGMLPAAPNATKSDIDLSPSLLYLEDWGGSLTIDELRIGTTYADVSSVPETNSMALLIVGTLILAVASRRRL